jgi:hypothetical protein
MVEPPDPAALRPELETVRIDLVGSLFERGRAARRRLAEGDADGARTMLGPSVWLELWDRAAAHASAAFKGAVEQELREAGAFSRYSPRRLRALMPTAEDARVLSAKFSAAGIGLESAAPQLSNPGVDWQEALRRAAGELEEGWRQLRNVAELEHASWSGRVTLVREWRRPWRPLVLGGLAALAAVTWIGLVIGGYLPVPGWFRPVAEWAWSLPWP